jgi:hypothetical protein
MSEPITLRLLDQEEALADASRETRADLFRRAAVGGGTLAAGGLLIGGLPSLALGRPSARQDGQILNFALLLEYLESEFYVQAVAGGALTGELLTFATTVRDHELAHVDFLREALGDAAIAKPAFDFKGTTAEAGAFTATAIALEDTGVAAYNGQGPRLRRRTLGAAASIVSVEARHAAWIRHIAGERPAPNALDPAKSRKQVTRIVTRTGFIAG